MYHVVKYIWAAPFGVNLAIFFIQVIIWRVNSFLFDQNIQIISKDIGIWTLDGLTLILELTLRDVTMNHSQRFYAFRHPTIAVTNMKLGSDLAYPYWCLYKKIIEFNHKSNILHFLCILQFWHINDSLRCHDMSALVWKCALNGRSRRLVRYFPAPIFCQIKYGSSRTHFLIKLGTNLQIDFWNSEKPGLDIICSTARDN